MTAGGVLGSGLPIVEGPAAQGPLVRIETPEDVLALLDGGAEGIIALVPDAGASFLAPIQEELGGLVCRTGNVESHLAIVSREFGTPAIMAFVFTADEPPDGQLVELDPTAGTLSLLAAT